MPAESVRLQWKSTVLAQTQIARILSTARGEYLFAPTALVPGRRAFSLEGRLRFSYHIKLSYDSLSYALLAFHPSRTGSASPC